MRGGNCMLTITDELRQKLIEQLAEYHIEYADYDEWQGSSKTQEDREFYGIDDIENDIGLWVDTFLRTIDKAGMTIVERTPITEGNEQ